jgi:predicted transposase YdaD
VDRAPKPHDALVHRVFVEGDLADVADVLRSAVPAPIAVAIDWKSLARVEGTFVDDALREHQTDLLLSASMLGRKIFLFVVFDAKSTADPGTPFQMHRYVTRVLERHEAEHGPGAWLPPVIPFVLYSGSRPWTGPRCVLDRIDLRGLPRPVARWLRRLQPNLRILIDDLSQQDDAALRARMTGAVTLLALMALRQRRYRDLAAATGELLRWLDVFAEIARAPSRRAMMRVLMNYLIQTRELDMPRVRVELRAVLGAELEDELMKTTADILRQEGKAEGRAEGRTEGRTEGQADLLLRQLEKRFGPLPQATVARVRQGGSRDLERWADAVLTASTLAAVFAAEP